MPNRWITFVKQWASSNNMTYGCALSKPELKAAYHKEYPKAIKLPKGVKKSEESRPPAEDNEADDNDYNSQADTVVMSDSESDNKPPLASEKKKRGRPQKYKSEEEVYKAKLESNKLKRREARAAKKAAKAAAPVEPVAAPVEPVAAPVEPVAAPVEPEKKKIYKEAKFKEILKMPERYANWFNNTFVKEFKAKSTKEQKKEVKEATLQTIKNFIRNFEGRIYGSPHESDVKELYNFIKQTKTAPLGLLGEIAVSDADIIKADEFTRESEQNKMRYNIRRVEPAFRLFVMANKILPITDRDTKKLLSDIGVRVVNQKAGEGWRDGKGYD